MNVFNLLYGKAFNQDCNFSSPLIINISLMIYFNPSPKQLFWADWFNKKALP